MGSTTSTTVINNVTIIVYNVPSDILGLAVENLGLTPAPEGDTAAGKDQQTINDNVPQKTKEKFADGFGYQMPPTTPPSLPKGIHEPSDGSDPDFVGSNSESYWYLNNDSVSDANVTSIVTDAVNTFGQIDGIVFFTSEGTQDIVTEITNDIKSAFKQTYSAWTSFAKTYYGKVNKLDTGKNVRARIDLAFYAYHGKDSDQIDGVYLDIKSAYYVADYNPI